jgi:hypothetical protein
MINNSINRIKFLNLFIIFQMINYLDSIFTLFKLLNLLIIFFINTYHFSY